MKVIKVDGTNGCYIFENGESVPFDNKKRYAELKHGEIYSKPPEPPKADKAAEKPKPDNADGIQSDRRTDAKLGQRARGRRKGFFKKDK